MRKILFLAALAALLIVSIPGYSYAVGSCSIYKSFVTGDSVSANDLNSLQTTIGVTNFVLSCLDDYSANATQMQSTTDPYVSSAEVLATSLQIELTNLRHVIKQLTGWTYWYTHTDDFNKTTTWNTAARNFCGLCQTITDTNSHASSRLLDFRRGGTIRVQMDKSGNFTYYGGNVPANGQLFIGNATTGTWQAATLTAGSNVTITNAAGAITVAATAASFKGARVYNDANLSIDTGTDTKLTFNTERYDTDAFHSTSTNTGRLTIPTGEGGYYRITAIVRWADGTGGRRVQILLNGTTVIGQSSLLSSTSAALLTTQTAIADYSLVAGDYVEVQVQQGGAGALNVDFVSNYSPEFMLEKLGS